MDIRKALLKPKLKSQVVHLPSLGVDVTVQEMTADRLQVYESLIYQFDEDGKAVRNADHLQAKIAVCTAVDDKGELLFKPEDVEALSVSYGKDIKRIAEAGARLSGLYDQESVEKN